MRDWWDGIVGPGKLFDPAETCVIGINVQAITPALAASSGETLRQLAIAGQGIVCLSDFMTRDDIAAGRLVTVLESFSTGYRQQVHAVYYRNTQLSQRISCFLEFLQQKL